MKMLTESKGSAQHSELMRRQKQLCEPPAQSKDSGVCRDGPKPRRDQMSCPWAESQEQAGRQNHVEEPTMELSGLRQTQPTAPTFWEGQELKWKRSP